MQASLRASEERLQEAIKSNKPDRWDKWLPAILGLLGVCVGAGINVWLQRRQLASTERANRASAAFQSQTKIIEYRSQQAHEFYYPLYLMLQRSSGVRRQLCDHLARTKPERFAFLTEADGPHLFVLDPKRAAPVRFRLIEAMHELATDYAEALPMVQEIVAIGEKMSSLIHDKGGLALSSNAALTDLLGKYLAHFSILREVAEKAKNPDQLKGMRYNVLYPIELDGQLKADIAFLQNSIEEWSRFSAQLWREAMPSTPMPSLIASK